MGRLWEIDPQILRANRQTECRRCDWECFRDPSELFGPLLRGLSQPWRLVGEHRRDPHFLRLWAEDCRYARACNLYDGRKAPDYKLLKSFASAFPREGATGRRLVCLDGARHRAEGTE